MLVPILTVVVPVVVPTCPIFIDDAAPDPPPILINPNPVLLPDVPIFKAPVVWVVLIPTSVALADALNEGDITDVPVIAPPEEIDPDAVAIDKAVVAPSKPIFVAEFPI